MAAHHLNDPYVQRANAEGYRARAAYKLMEIDDREHLLRRGGVVVDLGAAPGSWCQVAVQRCGPTGKVFALDILPMEAVHGVDFLQGDFTEDSVLEALEKRLGAVDDGTGGAGGLDGHVEHGVQLGRHDLCEEQVCGRRIAVTGSGFASPPRMRAATIEPGILTARPRTGLIGHFNLVFHAHTFHPHPDQPRRQRRWRRTRHEDHGL